VIMRVLLGFVFLLCFSLPILHGQDSVQYIIGKPIQDAIFLSYEDFRHQSGIFKDSIDFPGDKDQLEYLSKSLDQEKFHYKTKGQKISVTSNQVWGYVQNGTFYVNFNKVFYRIPVFGSISFLVAMVEVRQTGFYDPRFGGYTGSMVTTEQREFIMNFYEGKLKELKQNEVELLLSRDKELYKEYSALSSRKQKEQLYRFIRKYNQNNPVYFLN